MSSEMFFALLFQPLDALDDRFQLVLGEAGCGRFLDCGRRRLRACKHRVLLSV
jgi:hypothetical protein